LATLILLAVLLIGLNAIEIGINARTGWRAQRSEG
jgi:hypothetical protein